ncbi:hypothetical protein CI102_6849 [Trichoderma harzianum]|uniref:Uncharacterized protein n=1 Tax=Trichoderma harzianum CBS 226.95 TaxID=983964 RepID=A0A2T4AEM7_TRIHA|nr:hypothetical protein M431DRAFT_401695 [Trichoderma harzianum CBS 226.95]PKK50282.1 hypothetical protein CI102_6849 [Trichoderma harzianum]PTB55473.1 hypothetical protein M431DRAFT_401695 [Trichoderma harzianum CBS 226.95]
MDSEQILAEYARLQSATTLENPILNNIVVACCGVISPAYLSTMSVLLPAIAYPLLSPRAAHGLLVCSFFLNSHAFMIQHDLWKMGDPYTNIAYWKPAFASFCLAIGMVGLTRGQYRETQPRHTFFLGVIPWFFVSLTAWILYVFVILLEEEVKGYSVTREARLKKFCTITPIVLTVVCFKKFGRPVSIIMSQLVARRVRWLFRFRPSDVEANANSDIVSYSPAAFETEASEFLWRHPIEHDLRFRNSIFGRADDASYLSMDIHYGYDNSRWPLSAREIVLTLLVYLAILGLVACQVYGPKSEKGRP